jgi:hypothetical protein
MVLRRGNHGYNRVVGQVFSPTEVFFDSFGS